MSSHPIAMSIRVAVHVLALVACSGPAAPAPTAAPVSPASTAPALASAPARHGDVPRVEHADITNESGDGLFDPSELLSAIETKRAAVIACYDERLTVVPTLHGELGLAFDVGASDTHVRRTGGELVPADDALVECALRELGAGCASLRTQGGERVTYELTMRFDPPEP